MKKEFRFLSFFLPLMLSPVLSYGSPKPIDFSRHEGSTGITASIQYKPAVPYFSGFKIEDAGKPLKTYAAKKDGEATDPAKKDSFVESAYTPRYDKSTGKFSGSLGYSAGMFRIEAEGMHHEFSVDKSNFSNIKNAQTFAMAKVEKSGTASSTSTSSSSSGTQPTNTLPDYYVTAVNEGVIVTSLLGNICYDIIPAESKISPHICAGAGMSFIKFLGVMNRRISYQAKAGIQYFLSSRSIIFVSAYATRITPGKFEKIPVTHQKANNTTSSTGTGSSSAGSSATTDITHLYPSANFDTAYYGLECGIRLTFSL